MQQFDVTGMSCAACSARVEKAVTALPGVESCAVSLLTNSMAVEGEVPAEAIVAAVTAAGYGEAEYMDKHSRFIGHVQPVKDEAEAKAPKGTYICFDTDYVEFGDGYVSAKALDDRVGIFNLLKVLEDDYDCDVICVFASQEETGCRGSKGAAFALGASLAFVTTLYEQVDYLLVAVFEASLDPSQPSGIDWTPNTEALTERLLRKGLVLNNQYQEVDGLAVYPIIYFCEDGESPDKYATHYFTATWLPKEIQRKNARHRAVAFVKKKIRKFLGNSIYDKLKNALRK